MSIKQELLDLLIQWDLNNTLAQLLVTVFAVVVWFIVGLILIIIMKQIVNRSFKLEKRTQRTITIVKLLQNVFKYVIWFIIIIIMLGEMNIDATPIIASAGVLGLAVGFGAQTIVKDFISGFFIILEGSFNVTDVIEIDGFKGNVLSIGLRVTRIRNWKGEIKTINNGDIRGIINYSRENSLAIIDFGVAYDTDLEKLKGLMLEFCETTFAKYEEIVEKPDFLGVDSLGDSSINLRLIAKTANNKHFAVQRNVRKDVIELLGQNDIEIPFPHVVVKND